MQWLSCNRRRLLAAYKNQYVAYNANGMIAHSENLQEVLVPANSSQEDSLIYLVTERTASIQILPIHLTS